MKILRVLMIASVILLLGLSAQGCFFFVGHHYHTGWRNDDHHGDRHDNRGRGGSYDRHWSHERDWDRRR